MLKRGQKVLVALPPNEIGVNLVMEYQGKVSTIKDFDICRKRTTRLGIMYTLTGFRSDRGKDYWFCEDWLVPLDDEEEVTDESA